MAIKPKIKTENGFSLVETMIAVLLLAVVVTSVFSLAFTTKSASIRTDRRAVALQAMVQAREKVKAYVRASDATTATGPNTAWKLPEEDCDGSGKYLPVDTSNMCSSPCYALQWGPDPKAPPASPCTHNVSKMLPGKYLDDPYRMRLTYTVLPANSADPDPNAGFKVEFQATWAE